MKLKFNYRNWQQLIVLTQSPLFQVQHADLSSTYQSDLLLRQRGSDECVPLVTQWTRQQQHPVNYASRSSREKEVRKQNGNKHLLVLKHFPHDKNKCVPLPN